jgi:hypothetical protein
MLRQQGLLHQTGEVQELPPLMKAIELGVLASESKLK